MDEFEICQMYRLAKNQQEQIGIIAELNACRRGKIVEILRNHGFEITEPKKRGRPSSLTQEEKDKILEMALDGKSTREIAAEVSRGEKTISSHLHRLRATGEIIRERRDRGDEKGSIQHRLRRLGKTQIDLLDEIHKRGYPKLMVNTLNHYINNRSQSQQAEAVMKKVEKVLEEWENDKF